MTIYHYWRCDQCGKILENAECVANQLMFTLIANYDTDEGHKVHFCGKDCLKKYVDENVKEHMDLLPVNKDDEPVKSQTLGQLLEEKERK